MNNQIGGNCGKCGAPYYVPTVWNGILPPTPQPTCNCWNTGKIYTTTDRTSIGFDLTQHRALTKKNNDSNGYKYESICGIQVSTHATELVWDNAEVNCQSCLSVLKDSKLFDTSPTEDDPYGGEIIEDINLEST